MLLAVPLPPPLHGQSAATMHFVRLLEERGYSPQIADLSVSSGTRFGEVAGKLWRHLIAAAMLASERRSFYISANSNAGMWLTAGLVCLARVRGCRTFVHHHTYDHVRRRRNDMAAMAQFGGPHVTHIVLAPKMASDLKVSTPEVATTFVLNNAGLIDRSLLTIPIRSNTPLVLGHLSNLTAEKGVTETVDLAIAVRDLFPEARLILAGPATDAAARSALIAARRHLGERFEYRGPVHGARKHQFFSDITHFVFPTRYKNEASPLVLLEAMASGASCIATARACIPDTIGLDGGLAIEEADDFVERAAFHLRQTYGQSAAASSSARSQYLRLLREHEAQMDALVTML